MPTVDPASERRARPRAERQPTCWTVFAGVVLLIVGSLAEVGVRYSLLTFGLEDLAYDPVVIRILTVVLILVMTAICVWGTEISARVQNVLIVFQVLSLLAFAVVNASPAVPLQVAILRAVPWAFSLSRARHWAGPLCRPVVMSSEYASRSPYQSPET